MFNGSPDKICVQKVQQGNNLNIETMKQEIEQEKLAKTETNREN